MLYIFIQTLFASNNFNTKVVEVEKASLKNITETARLIGTVEAKRSMILVAKKCGVLGNFQTPGEKVLKDQVIAQMINREFEENYKLSANIESIAKAQYERASNLEKKQAESKQNVEGYKNRWIDAQKNLAHAKIALDDMRFVAPFDGIVGVFKVREGAQVSAGTVIGSFYDPSQLIVTFDIPAPLIHKVDQNKLAIVNNQHYKIDHVQKMIDQETHMSPCYVDIKCDQCFIGANIDIEVVTAEQKNVIVIPYEAVFIKNGKTSVYIVQNNKAILREVKTGIRDKEKIEIQSGIADGDLVIIRGQSRLYPDVAVKIHENK